MEAHGESSINLYNLFHQPNATYLCRKTRWIDFGDFTSQKINLDLRLNTGVIFVPEHRFENSDRLEFG